MSSGSTYSPLFDGGRDGHGSTLTFNDFVGKIVDAKGKTAGQKVDMTGSTDSNKNYLLDLDDPELTVTIIAMGDSSGGSGFISTGDTGDADFSLANGDDFGLPDAQCTVEWQGKIGEAIAYTVVFFPNYIAPDSGDDSGS
jgi:hypothetical protein